MERQVFPIADNRCHYGRLGCGTDQSQDGYFKLYWPYRYDLWTVLTTRVGYRHIAYVLHKKWLVVAVFCSAKLLWDIRLFVWRKFHFFCGTAVSCTCILQTTAWGRQSNMAVWECYCSYHFVVEVKVSCISVERN